MTVSSSLCQAFLRNIVVSDTPNGCWHMKFVNPDGIAVLEGDKQSHWGNRISHRMFFPNAELGRDLVFPVKCHNLGCVNPWHLQPVTRREFYNLLLLLKTPDDVDLSPWGCPFCQETGTLFRVHCAAGMPRTMCIRCLREVLPYTEKAPH